MLTGSSEQQETGDRHNEFRATPSDDVLSSLNRTGDPEGSGSDSQLALNISYRGTFNSDRHAFAGFGGESTVITGFHRSLYRGLQGQNTDMLTETMDVDQQGTIKAPLDNMYFVDDAFARTIDDGYMMESDERATDNEAQLAANSENTFTAHVHGFSRVHQGVTISRKLSKRNISTLDASVSDSYLSLSRHVPSKRTDNGSMSRDTSCILCPNQRAPEIYPEVECGSSSNFGVVPTKLSPSLPFGIGNFGNDGSMWTIDHGYTLNIIDFGQQRAGNEVPNFPIPGALSLTIHPLPSWTECLIMEDGQKCSERLTTENYREHFAQDHKKDNLFQCRWNGCGMILAARHRLLTHLETHSELDHIRQKFCCSYPGCCRQFSRKDGLTRHEKAKHIDSHRDGRERSNG
ncbi:hypothetical protein GYMLUDRAFT_73514 [Collybiopsis luxurians FD-317 M1]|uniref:C2H2-type domain-containing protein n=1 Tax=Collybiopsis luxurians FD-317 M1 TaxID=944289 RepID=A0A0D0CXV0_9AGAR|nr:hypothetical protein GYMLUDRAFT_73514 [Collybiopsis luxurians FD-317 M1]